MGLGDEGRGVISGKELERGRTKKRYRPRMHSRCR